MIKKLFEPDSFLFNLSVKLFCLFFSLWMWTVRREIIGNTDCLEDDDESSIICFWHNQVLALSYAFTREICEKSTGMVSRSRDGQLIAEIMMSRGFSVVRGSAQKKNKDKGGARAFIESLRVLRQPNKLMCIVPDGPRGPIYEAQPGAAALANKSAKKLIPVGARYSRSISLPTWDKLYIPLPFSNMIIEFGEAVDVSDQETAKPNLESGLNKVSQLT